MSNNINFKRGIYSLLAAGLLAISLITSGCDEVGGSQDISDNHTSTEISYEQSTVITEPSDPEDSGEISYEQSTDITEPSNSEDSGDISYEQSSDIAEPSDSEDSGEVIPDENSLISSPDSPGDISEGDSDTEKKPPLTVHFMDVGQGDSIFIELPSGKCMLIDAAESDKAARIIEYIHFLGYDSIDYMVATHPHSDHIGGMSKVITALPVKKAYLSPASHTTTSYRGMLASLVWCEAKVKYVMAGDDISDGEVKIEVVAPKTDSFDNLNNASVVILMTYGQNRFLFTGDAEKSEEDGIWTNIKCDVLKVGHHGSSSSTSANFLKKTEPSYAVISCAAGNSYGHPHREVMNRLEKARVKLFRTDLQGDIVFTSDGKDITVNVKPTEDYTSGSGVMPDNEDNSSEEPPETEPPATEPSGTEPPETEPPATEPPTTEPPATEPTAENSRYVLNTNTMKIHYPDCSSVKQIKDANKGYTNDYEWAVAHGYEPCKRCNPR